LPNSSRALTDANAAAVAAAMKEVALEGLAAARTFAERSTRSARTETA